MTGTSANSVRSVAERMSSIVREFGTDADWEAKYARVIQKGKALSELPAAYRDEKFKVKGCQSQVWLHAELSSEGRMLLHGDSDAVIVRGLVACLIEVYGDAKPSEILASSPNFLKEIGFDSHLSPSRANGLHAMVKQIYLYAAAFDALARSGSSR